MKTRKPPRRMNEFRIGDAVQLLDELTRGTVLEVLPGKLRLLTKDGFEIEVNKGA